MKGGIIAGSVVAGLLVLVSPIIALALLMGSVLFDTDEEAEDGPVCSTTLEGVQNEEWDEGSFSSAQKTNALFIIQVGQERNVSPHGQAIAVMTAIGESRLRNLDYGDDISGVKNPDGTPTSSIGLFQQQKWYEPTTAPQKGEPGWGYSPARLDPVYASHRFYDDLLNVPDWETLEPTQAAHKAQRNKDPDYYTQFYNKAVLLVSELTGLSVIDIAGTFISDGCAVPGDTDPTSPIVEGGWALPAEGPVTSRFGPRRAPVPGASTTHKGTDIGASCYSPLYAAAGGQVITAGLGSGNIGNMITIDHGNGTRTNYLHIMSGTFSVVPTQVVNAGQQIAQVGGDKKIDPKGAGTSSGCHLHFEVRVDGQLINPEPFMVERGITLGTPR